MMEPALKIPLGCRMPHRLHPLLLSWTGQVMPPREERASS
jgi:hypothetical protein